MVALPAALRRIGDFRLSKPGGVEALNAAGFVKRQEADEVVYVCDNPSPALSKVKAMLEEALAAV